VNSIRFLALFALLFFVPYALMHFVPLNFACEAVAGVEAYALRALGYPVAWDGVSLAIGETSLFKIIPDCTGLVMVFLFAALLWAAPLKRPASRVRELAFYTPFLLAFNLVRLLATLLAHYHFGPTGFDAVHAALWFADSGVVLWCWSRASGVRLL